MITQIKGLHHVTSVASDPQQNSDFFTQILGLRRVKKTVNFDNPEVYHLYYGDEVGTPGSVMTYFPFPDKPRGKAGSGEAGKVAFAVPEGSLPYWQTRLEGLGIDSKPIEQHFGESQLLFPGPDGETLAIVEVPDDSRSVWSGSDVPEDVAIRGFHSVALHLHDPSATADLMRLMGYELVGQDGNDQRFSVPEENGAGIIDIHQLANAEASQEGAGSVHHVAFSVANRADQLIVRQAMIESGYKVTEVLDRNYFWAIYFRTPGGILFEVATDEPGFAHDEDVAHLGEALKLPTQYARRRQHLESILPPITS